MNEIASEFGEGQAIWDLVVDDMRARDAFGAQKYGSRLMADDGRNSLRDAYEEVLDLAVYLRKALAEREGPDRDGTWQRPWIGVDLDGTLAQYDHYRGPDHIGDPVEPMLERVKGWLEEGRLVKVLTARVWPGRPVEAKLARAAIEEWLVCHLGQVLEVTHEKDPGLIELWDDRAVQVEANRGQVAALQRLRAEQAL